MRAGRVPVAHVHREPRLFHDPGFAALQELVEEAHRLVAPLHPRVRVRLVRERVRPRPDHRLHRRALHVLEHARQRVAVAVVPAADQEPRDLDRVVALDERGALPERVVALLRLVGEHPRRRVEALLEERLVDAEIGRARERVVQVLAHLPRVHVDDAVHEVHVVLVEVVGGVDRDERLQRGRVAHRHVDRVEPAPRDAEHADVAVRERLLRQPVDHDLAVLLLDVAVLVGDDAPGAVAGAADVHPRHHVAALHEVGVHRPVAAARLGLAVRQVFEDDGKALASGGAVRHVEVGSERHAAGQRNRGVIEAHAVFRGRCGERRGSGRRGRRQGGKDQKCGGARARCLHLKDASPQGRSRGFPPAPSRAVFRSRGSGTGARRRAPPGATRRRRAPHARSRR